MLDVHFVERNVNLNNNISGWWLGTHLGVLVGLFLGRRGNRVTMCFCESISIERRSSRKLVMEINWEQGGSERRMNNRKWLIELSGE